MPSPFPGMDPFVEGRAWSPIHFQLNAEIARQLNPQLVPKYIALPAERHVMEEEDSVAIATNRFEPDVSVSRFRETETQPRTSAILEPPMQLEAEFAAMVRQVTIEIRDIAQRTLVTAIEVLSLTNKIGGRDEYLTKRRRLLAAGVHLLEIDWLRAGRRMPMRQPLPDCPYFVMLYRSDKLPVADVWPIALDQTLPVVPVPLQPGDADVSLDLQAAFTSVYDQLAYGYAMDYSQSPDVELTPPQSAWVENRLRALGLRS